MADDLIPDEMIIHKGQLLDGKFITKFDPPISCTNGTKFDIKGTLNFKTGEVEQVTRVWHKEARQ